MIELKIKDATRFIVKRCDSWKAESPLYVLTIVYDNEKDDNNRVIKVEYDWNTLKYSVPRVRKIADNIKPYNKDIIKKVFAKAGIECGKSNENIELPKEIWRNDLKEDVIKQIELINMSGYPRLGGLSSNTALLEDYNDIELDFKISIDGLGDDKETDTDNINVITYEEVITVDQLEVETETEDYEEEIDLGFSMGDFVI